MYLHEHEQIRYQTKKTQRRINKLVVLYKVIPETKIVNKHLPRLLPAARAVIHRKEET